MKQILGTALVRMKSDLDAAEFDVALHIEHSTRPVRYHLHHQVIETAHNTH